MDAKQDKLNYIAANLEELTIIQKEVVKNLRSGDASSYAQVYWLRWKLGKIVALFGNVGVPQDLERVGAMLLLDRPVGAMTPEEAATELERETQAQELRHNEANKRLRQIEGY